MDLMDFNTEEKADQGIDIEIFLPTGEPSGIFVNMCGSDSQAYLDADRKIRNRQLEQAKRKRDFSIGMEPEAIEAGLIERMKACFNGWKQKTGADADGVVTYKPAITVGGSELGSNKEEFAKLISRRGFFWFRQQLQEGMDKVANFLPQPKSGLSPTPTSTSSTSSQASQA
jgi:hypothetical protein